MQFSLRKLFAVSLIFCTTIISPAVSGANAAPANVRGKVVSATTDTLTVTTNDDKVVQVMLTQGWQIAAVAKASLSDIKPGDYVGIASVPKSNGGDGALEVLIFPPMLKGTAEGSFAYDLAPNSSMTNATVNNIAKSVEGQVVTVSYHGKDKKIEVPASAPVVTLAPATPADLTPGAVVFVIATKDEKGSMAALQVVVGKDGVIPPM
jgi:hypothetical protein